VKIQEMKRVCYFCNGYMGEKYGYNDENGVFHSVCDQCSIKLKLEEKLPALLVLIAKLRTQSGN